MEYFPKKKPTVEELTDILNQHPFSLILTELKTRSKIQVINSEDGRFMLFLVYDYKVEVVLYKFLEKTFIAILYEGELVRLRRYRKFTPSNELQERFINFIYRKDCYLRTVYFGLKNEPSFKFSVFRR